MPRRSRPDGAIASRRRGRPPIARRVSDQRGQLLRAALGFAGLPRPSNDRSRWALRTWLDSWSGIGRIAVGMGHGYRGLRLPAVDPPRRAQNVHAPRRERAADLRRSSLKARNGENSRERAGLLLTS